LFLKLNDAFDTRGYVSSIIKDHSCSAKYFAKDNSVTQVIRAKRNKTQIFLGGSSLDRLYKSAARKAVVCHLRTCSHSTERFLRCCETPFRSSAQGYLSGKEKGRERKSYMKRL